MNLQEFFRKLICSDPLNVRVVLFGKPFPEQLREEAIPPYPLYTMNENVSRIFSFFKNLFHSLPKETQIRFKINE